MRRPVPRRRRRSVRLRDFDYTSPGAYFVTIVTRFRRCVFGEIRDGQMLLNDAGRTVEHCWLRLTASFPLARLDSLVVMPNHLHAIVFITDPEETVSPESALDDLPARRFGGDQKGIPGILRHMKAVTTTAYARGVRENGWLPFSMRLWQRDYDERIIRNEAQLRARREYILNNPLQWTLDEENPEHETRRGPKRQGH